MPTMTAVEALHKCGEALYGKNWLRRSAALMGISPTTISKWKRAPPRALIRDTPSSRSWRTRCGSGPRSLRRRRPRLIRGSSQMRSKHPDRDTDIIRRFVAGENTKRIAFDYGITGERVYQVVRIRTGLNRRKLRAMGNFCHGGANQEGQTPPVGLASAAGTR